ncbi:hypothetical protein FA13DRAFT_1806358 [Coprinellus micaceus]|uniref:CHAT domain-containing protein n=1 Tax=Coprinellus micaceus TaxID=71717 RepID=A0A4Y7RNB6_COPMI|nr:hypothetical protein FA13DRAFT_1806358 [Coprinellus micaceus]
MLESPTANDMRALLVGIDEFPSGEFGKLTKSASNVKNIASYLRDTLFVPNGQIKTLVNAEATKEEILKALNAFHEGPVAEGAPILIYFATHGCLDGARKRTYLIPHRDDEKLIKEDLKELAISYSSIVDILQRVANLKKTENITLILECQHAKDMGLNTKFSTAEVLVGHPSHILLAGEGSGGPPSRKPTADLLGVFPTKKDPEHGNNPSDAGNAGTEGRFTEALLQILTSPEFSDRLPTMTYKDLVESINNQSTEKLLRRLLKSLIQVMRLLRWDAQDSGPASPVSETDPEKSMSQPGPSLNAFCTTIYENRLLFNGLFSRKLTDKSSSPVITVSYHDRVGDSSSAPSSPS